ncbi:MAG: hypothetical protein AB9Q19_00465 [Candidatus Reddybacter sp.]
MSTLTAPNQPLVQAAPAGTFWDTLNSAGDFFGKVLSTATEYNAAKSSMDLERDALEYQSKNDYAEILRNQTQTGAATEPQKPADNLPFYIGGAGLVLVGLILVVSK